MTPQITAEDEGKAVVRGDETVGRVVEVEADDGTAYVDPDPSLADTVMTKLGWSEGKRADADTYPLREDTIEEVTDDQIRLREDL